MSSKKITILLPNLRGGGVERIRLVLAKEFKNRGHHVEFLLLDACGELLEEASSEFEVTGLGNLRARELLSSLVAYLRLRRPDALLVAMWPLSVIGPVARLVSGVRCRVVVSEHNILSLQYKNWGRRHFSMLRASTAAGYRLANRRIAVSRGVAEDMAHLSAMKRNSFDVINNPVTPRPAPTQDRLNAAAAAWGPRSGDRLISVGSLKPVKNQALLIQAFALIRRPESTLMIVGEGAEREALSRLAAELGIKDRVVFTGFLPDPTALYLTADLFVLSSNNEGFGNVLIEALSAGLPVVSTDCPSGPREILEDERWGRLAPVRDARALAKAIEHSLANPSDAETLKQRAADFSPELIAADYLAAMGIR